MNDYEWGKAPWYLYHESITSITIGNGVTSIGNNAFSGCFSLTNVTIGNGVTSIGNKAFYCCTNMLSVTIPNNVTSIGDGAFSDCISLTAFTFPNRVTSIESHVVAHCTNLKRIIVGNGVSQIGHEAFKENRNLNHVILGSSVEWIDHEAFENCSALDTVICYSIMPPTISKNYLDDISYNAIIYVPLDYLETYKMHDAWGLYDVRPLGAKSTETTEVNVTPSETTAEVVWPVVSGATTYELVIKDKNGNVICTLIFNSNGQLTQIAFNAPARDNAPQQTQSTGFAFTVTGLESGTGYDLTITSKDNNGSTLNSQTVSFTTTGEQALESVSAMYGEYTKLFRNGQILILRGNKTYTLTGQEVK